MKAVHYYFSELMENLSALGSIFVHVLLLAVAFALNDALLYPLLNGLVLIFAITVPAKFLVFRNRPMKMKYDNFWQKFEAASFPSVHSVRTMFLFLVLSARFSNMLLSAVLFALAAMIMYSRIHLKKHYWRDVIAGIIIGIVIYFLSSML